MCRNCLGPISCFSPSWIPLRTHHCWGGAGFAAVADGLMSGHIFLSALTWYRVDSIIMSSLPIQVHRISLHVEMELKTTLSSCYPPAQKILPGSLSPSVSQILFQLPLHELSSSAWLVFCLLVRPLGLLHISASVCNVPPTPTPLPLHLKVVPAQGSVLDNTPSHKEHFLLCP